MFLKSGVMFLKNTPSSGVMILTNHTSFRTKCNDIIREQRFSENFFVQALVSDALRWAWKLGDPTGPELMQQRHRQTIQDLSSELSKETNPDRRAGLKQSLDFTKRMIASAPERQKTAQRHYRVLCESVLPFLYFEELTYLTHLGTFE